MAEKWEQTFKVFGEKTHTITQLIQKANEGDDLSEPSKEIKQTTEEIVKAVEDLPSDVPDVYDEGVQLDLKNAAHDVVTAGTKLLASFSEKVDIWKSEKEVGKMVNQVISANNEVLAKPYPASNPHAPEIQGQSKKLQTEALKLQKQHEAAE